ncbi:DUF6361 family protein [Arthrobacter bussei]|uniref:Uncharacterized protein n=1 Tax=Arthrobacter bussei TaxID=2594179 RepID=A0A7X1NSA3_9MICC|nr:DUF6361 family protein [Arthrobacter bussei]MPY12096.1 hypothetical protein [Arthrobacter bussei]
MASTFAWLAVDAEQRRRMMEAVELFRDQGTIDDLGIGAIRDGISDTLFPGTSTLHTRLRYVLFVPWLLSIASQKGTAELMDWAFHDGEREFIDSLKRGMGDAKEGIIGRRAGRNLQRVPSAMYWGALTSWGIAEPGLSVGDYFRRCVLRRDQLRAAPRQEDGDTPIALTPTGIVPGLPHQPQDLLNSATFDLRQEEATFLAETITRSCAGSLLAHLVHQRPATWTDAASAPAYLWDSEVRRDLPPDLLDLVDLAERFSLVIQGANLLYNLLLAEATSGNAGRYQGDAIEDYRQKLTTWADSVNGIRPLDAADHHAIGLLMTNRRRAFTLPTQRFLTSWFDLARAPHDIPDGDLARRLVRERESAVKGGRARLRPGNWKALDAWGGSSGINRLEFRWIYARRHLQDIYDGLEAV